MVFVAAFEISIAVSAILAPSCALPATSLIEEDISSIAVATVFIFCDICSAAEVTSRMFMLISSAADAIALMLEDICSVVPATVSDWVFISSAFEAICAETVDISSDEVASTSALSLFCVIKSPRFLQELSIARADGSYPRLMNKIAKAKVLVIDDFCISPMTAVQRHDLLEVFEDRQDLSSVIIATQVPIKDWFDMIGDPTIADAILDRLIHNAHKIELKGESMRKIRSSLTKKKKSSK